MNRKLTEESFHYYVSLGDARRYRLVAEKFGVTVRAVTKYAARQGWPLRLAEIERNAREKLDEKIANEVVAANEMHLKVFRFVQARAVEAMKTQPFASSMDALKAYCLTLDRERVIRGEPSQRVAHQIESVTKSEVRRLVGTTDEPDELDAEDDASDEDDGDDE